MDNGDHEKYHDYVMNESSDSSDSDDLEEFNVDIHQEAMGAIGKTKKVSFSSYYYSLDGILLKYELPRIYKKPKEAIFAEISTVLVPIQPSQEILPLIPSQK